MSQRLVGGNDVGFDPLVTDCVYATGWGKGPGCETRDQSALDQLMGFLTTGIPSGCYPKPGVTVSGGTPPPACGPVESLSQLYASIVQTTPGAKLLVVGYPHLFGSSFRKGSCKVGAIGSAYHFYVSQGDAVWLNSEADTLDGIIKQAASSAAAATGADIEFVDPRTVFNTHSLCDTSKTWINPLLFKPATAWPPVTDKSESFHPNVTGQNALATLIEGYA